MKPKPFSPLNHFTVPCAIYSSSLIQTDAAWHPLLALAGPPERNLFCANRRTRSTGTTAAGLATTVLVTAGLPAVGLTTARLATARLSATAATLCGGAVWR